MTEEEEVVEGGAERSSVLVEHVPASHSASLDDRMSLPIDRVTGAADMRALYSATVAKGDGAGVGADLLQQLLKLLIPAIAAVATSTGTASEGALSIRTPSA